MNDRKMRLATVLIITALAVSVGWMAALFNGVGRAELSTRDHPDWWRPVGGSNAQDSTLERRSLIWNDGDPVAPAAPTWMNTGATYRGKFFTRGCRGKIEQLQIYCIRTAAGTLDLNFSPHPCLGPLYTLTVTPGAAWAWVAVNFEQMWNYDSLFIWVSRCDADVSYGYDTETPQDSHRSADAGVTWYDVAARHFIRAIYTGETPGDVPVSGIINNIPIPSTSSSVSGDELELVGDAAWHLLREVEGAGYCDFISFQVNAGASSQATTFRVYCDGEIAMYYSLFELSVPYGVLPTTPTISLTQYGDDAVCCVLIHKKFEFRRLIQFYGYNALANQTVTVRMHPTLMQ